MGGSHDDGVEPRPLPEWLRRVAVMDPMWAWAWIVSHWADLGA